MLSNSTFWPLTASRCASPDRWKSVFAASAIASSWPSTMPRSSAASGARSPAAEPARGALAGSVERSGQTTARAAGARP